MIYGTCLDIAMSMVDQFLSGDWKLGSHLVAARVYRRNRSHSHCIVHACLVQALSDYAAQSVARS